MTQTTTVIGLNLADLTPDGEPDPLSAAVLELCSAAARVATVPTEQVGATVALAALRAQVAEGLPETAGLMSAVLALIDLTEQMTKGDGHD